jgi:hypothetical protein
MSAKNPAPPKIFCSQKSSKNPIQKLPKNLLKIRQKSFITKQKSMAKILVACEESQTITKILRQLGHDAFSCDILPCSGGHPEWHIQCDVFSITGGGGI